MRRRGLFGSAPTYDTPLTPQQAPAFDEWRSRLPGDLQNDEDYDLRGAYLAAAQADGRLHMTDQFKKPNHMTFSEGSQYSTPQAPGGRWVDTGLPNPNTPGENAYVFWASQQNMRAHPVSILADYFKNYEPGNVPVLPISYNLPRRR